MDVNAGLVSTTKASSNWPGEAAGRPRGLEPGRAATVSSTLEPVEAGTILTLEVEVSSPVPLLDKIEERIASNRGRDTQLGNAKKPSRADSGNPPQRSDIAALSAP